MDEFIVVNKSSVVIESYNFWSSANSLVMNTASFVLCEFKINVDILQHLRISVLI